MAATKRIALLIFTAAGLAAAPVSFKQRCLRDLVAHTPDILASQDPKTGRFGQGTWIVNEQNAMLPLAAVWATKSEANPYFHDPKLLDAIMAAGDALIDDQDASGQWVFRKKDNSTWGNIYMPWTYSRWVRSFALIREAMPPARRARWEKALRLGYSGIYRDLEKPRLVNIPCHHAMGLYFAGQVLNEPSWRERAAEVQHKIIGVQHPDGYWSEHSGPVVLYGSVYVDALGTYYTASRDEAVLPALRKAAVFHSYFTYPDGTDVETVDERNFYHSQVRLPGPGMTVTPEGRAFLSRQLAVWKGRLAADDAALLLLYGQEGEGTDVTAGDFDYVLGKGDAAIRHRGPWFLVVSALTAPIGPSRWIQDRQNFVSVYHDRAGVVLGGGNTRLQPGWSTFTLGDTSLLVHRPGDENPTFTPPVGLVHVPGSARLLTGDSFGVELDYAGKRGVVRLTVRTPDTLDYTVSGDPALTAHLVTLSRHPTPDAAIPPAVELAPPPAAVLRWPLFPHDPYKKDGRPDADTGRAVFDVPCRSDQTFVLRIR